MPTRVTIWLKRTHRVIFIMYAVSAAFSVYFCMYGFRKAFLAATFSGSCFLGVDYKALLILSHITGYALSKFMGIKVVSDMVYTHRAAALLFCIAIAEGALMLFSVTPAPYNMIWLFVNGLPLGMIWGDGIFLFGGQKLHRSISGRV